MQRYSSHVRSTPQVREHLLPQALPKGSLNNGNFRSACFLQHDLARMGNRYVPPPPAPPPSASSPKFQMASTDRAAATFSTSEGLANYLVNCKEPEIVRLCWLPCNDHLLDGIYDGWAGLQHIADPVERIATRRDAFMVLVMEKVREGQAAWQAGWMWPSGTRRTFKNSR